MKLNTLPSIRGAKRPRKRFGCGVACGHGGTCTRGNKGGKARSGYSPAPVCSGIPYYRKLPIRGFNNARFRDTFSVVNLDSIAALQGVDVVDRNILEQAGLIRSADAKIKILGVGTITRPMSVRADKFSESAKSKILAAGGQVIEESVVGVIEKQG